MPKIKTHKGLHKRARITKSGKVRLGRPRSRHRKSNKSGIQVQSYRDRIFAAAGDIKRLKAMVSRPLRSREQAEAAKQQCDCCCDAAAPAKPAKAEAPAEPETKAEAKTEEDTEQ